MTTTIGQTTSTCPHCQALVPAKISVDAGQVYFQKYCREHGASRALIHGAAEQYLQAQRFVKPAWTPLHFAGDAGLECPAGCGTCERHEQHLCLPIVEITSRCNLACPICINASGGSADAGDLALADFSRMLDGLIAAERQIDVLNLSGGEPLLHPQLLALLDNALARREIVRVSISTNGLPLLERPDLLAALKERNVVLSLQLDGFDDRIYQVLRGRALLAEKERILALLEEADITTTLTMTAAAGVNDDQFPEMLKLLFGREHIVSMMIQPLAYAGRAARMDAARRLTIPDIVKLLGAAGLAGVAAEDFVPLPCSHPLCFSLAFYLMLDDGRPVSVNQLADAATRMDALANKVFFGLDAGEQERLKGMIYDLWSGPAAATPDGQAVLATLRGLLRSISRAGPVGCFDARQSFNIMERKVKSIFIHAFQDADTFDLARVRRCCQAYPQPDGKLLPVCVRNVLRQKKAGLTAPP